MVAMSPGFCWMFACLLTCSFCGNSAISSHLELVWHSYLISTFIRLPC